MAQHGMLLTLQAQHCTGGIGGGGGELCEPSAGTPGWSGYDLAAQVAQTTHPHLQPGVTTQLCTTAASSADSAAGYPFIRGLCHKHERAKRLGLAGLVQAKCVAHPSSCSRRCSACPLATGTQQKV